MGKRCWGETSRLGIKLEHHYKKMLDFDSARKDSFCLLYGKALCWVFAFWSFRSKLGYLRGVLGCQVWPNYCSPD